VDLLRLQAIRNKAVHTPEDHDRDIADAVRGSMMEKRRIGDSAPDVHMDVCRACSLAWFEGGELAMAEKHHETTGVFRNHQEAVARMRRLLQSPERMARFQENYAKLPAGSDDAGDAIEELGEALLWTLVWGCRRRSGQ
jgi:hypothetical protein